MCVLFVAGVCSETVAILDFNARSLGPYSWLLNFKPKHEFSSWVTSLGFPDNSVIFGGLFYPPLWMYTDNWFYCILMLFKYSQWNLCRAVGFKLVYIYAVNIFLYIFYWFLEVFKICFEIKASITKWWVIRQRQLKGINLLKTALVSAEIVMLMWESRHISERWSILKQFFYVIRGFAKLCCFEGERTVLSNNGENNLFILSWFLAEVDFWSVPRFFCIGKFFHPFTLWRIDHFEGSVKKKNIWWLDLFWHFLIQSFKSIAPLLHDCDLDATSLQIQLSAHVSEFLLTWFSIT